MAAGYIPIQKVEPSAGSTSVKDASAAPSKVMVTSAAWRALFAGAALSLAARRKRKVEMAKVFIVDAC